MYIHEADASGALLGSEVRLYLRISYMRIYSAFVLLIAVLALSAAHAAEGGRTGRADAPSLTTAYSGTTDGTDTGDYAESGATVKVNAASDVFQYLYGGYSSTTVGGQTGTSENNTVNITDGYVLSTWGGLGVSTTGDAQAAHNSVSFSAAAPTYRGGNIYAGSAQSSSGAAVSDQNRLVIGENVGIVDIMTSNPPSTFINAFSGHALTTSSESATAQNNIAEMAGVMVFGDLAAGQADTGVE